MLNRMIQAMGTFRRIKTMIQPPNWPNKLMMTNMVARNFPQPHEISMYSLCSFHWNHIRIPSSKNVDMRHNLAMWGSTVLVLLKTCRLSRCHQWWMQVKGRATWPEPLVSLTQALNDMGDTNGFGRKRKSTRETDIKLYLPHQRLLQRAKPEDVALDLPFSMTCKSVQS